MGPKNRCFCFRFLDFFRIPTFGRILDDFGLTLGSLWRPLAPLGAPFGALVAPVGVPWGAFAPHLVPFGLILVALWLQLGSFGPFLVAFWPLWFHFGSFWFAFRFFLLFWTFFGSHTFFLRPAAAGKRDRSKIDEKNDAKSCQTSHEK